jgi:hypothetical protein
MRINSAALARDILVGCWKRPVACSLLGEKVEVLRETLELSGYAHQLLLTLQ